MTSRQRVESVLKVRETQEGIAKGELAMANNAERLAREAVDRGEL